MTDLDRQVRATQRRLWTNAWFDRTCWALTAAAGAFGATVVFVRLYGLDWPLGWTALATTGLAVAAGTVWTHVTRASRDSAAAALDQAAGLRERISTGLYCQDDQTQAHEPFAHAVVDDAERVARLVSVRIHLPLRAPFTAVYSGMAMAVAALLLLLPAGMLVGQEPGRARADSEELVRTKVEVRQRLDRIKKLAQTNPALKDLEDKLEELDRSPVGRMDRPEQVRHEAIKKIDKLGDVLRERRQSDRLDAVNQVKKMLRGIKTPGETNTPAQKLTKALAEGDFKTAQEQIKALQEKLATVKSPQDLAKLEATKKQLEELAKKLSAVADDKGLKQKLEQAGLKKEDIERMLQRLTKKDLDQLKKQLEKQGLSQKDIQKLTRQLQKRQQACSMCKQMSQALSQAAGAAAAGQMGQAIARLDSAGDQLSEMEMLEQEMAQIDSMMAELQSEANGLDSKCSGGRGGKGQGPGMGGKPGQGRGGLVAEEQTAVRFKTHRQQVHTGKGRIIGQFLVDGKQVKGEVSDELAEVIAAEERDATDLIHHDRIPRQYHKPVKDYFSGVQRQIGSGRELDSAADQGD